MSDIDQASRRAVLIVAILFLIYFALELTMALAIGAASLVADSTDFLEDASFNIIVFVAMSWSAKNRARAGMVLSVILFVPTLAFLWEAVEKILDPMPPEAFALSLAGLGALALTVSSAAFLALHREAGGSLTRAAFLSVRTHALSNVAIIAAGLVTGYLWKSMWPDLLVGTAIALVNLDAVREVWQAARQEQTIVA